MHTAPSAHDLDARGAFGREALTACDCCGVPSVDLDAMGRCAGALCALASRVDTEVPSALAALTLRASRIAFARRGIVALPFGRTIIAEAA